MDINNDFTFNEHINNENLLNNFKKIEGANPHHLLWIDKKGRLHSAGLVRQIFENIGTFFGRRSIKNAELQQRTLLVMLSAGLKRGLIQENQCDFLFSSFSTYQARRLASNTMSLFQKTFHKDRVNDTQLVLGAPVLEMIRHKSAIKIQQCFRRWQTQINTVMPSQIIPQLKEHLKGVIEDKDLERIAIALCREINAIAANPELYEGKSIELFASQRYLLPVIVGKTYQEIVDNKHVKTTKEIALEFDCWIEMPKLESRQKRRRIDLLVCTTQKIGSGSYKTIYRAESFKIELQLNKKSAGSQAVSRPIQHENRVVMTAVNNEKERNIVLKGMEAHQKLQATPGVKTPALPTPRLPSADGDEVDPLKVSQTRYLASLHTAMTTGVPVNFSKQAPIRALSCDDRLEICKDLAKILSGYHSEVTETGEPKDLIVHRDVKPANILLSYQKEDKKNKIKIHLSDFDLTRVPGFSNISGKYSYWDAASQKGWVLPLTDSYGIAMMMGELFLPGFNKFRNDPTLFDRDRVMTGVIADLTGIILKISPIFNHLKDCRTREEFDRGLKQCSDAASSLNANARKGLEELSKKWKCQKEAIDIADSLFKSSVAVDEYITSHPEIRKGLRDKELSVRMKAIKLIEIECPYLSAKDIFKRLETLT